MKVPIAGMTDDRCRERRTRQIFSGFSHAFSQPRNWYTNVARPKLSIVAQRFSGVGCVVTSTPKLVTIFRFGAPAEIRATMFRGDQANHSCLFGNAGCGTVKFQP